MISTQGSTTASPQEKSFNVKSKVLWTLLFIVIAALSIWAVASQTQNFSFKSFWDFIKEADIFWIISAIVSMLGFIFFEGFALVVICRSYGFKSGLRHGFVYSAADIYFSAITPSATGGQPASAFFMMKNGLPGTFATMALIVNLVMYAASTVALGLLALLVNPGLFVNFGTLSELLIGVGFLIQIGLLILFILLLTKKGLLSGICAGFLKLLAKVHLIRRLDRKLDKLSKKVENFSKHTHKLQGKSKMLVAIFLLNLLQRIAQVAVTPFTYLASGGELSEAFDVFLTQIYVTMGANSIPVPGAMGVTDYLMLDGFEELRVANHSFLELLSRSLSFYMCIIICGVVVLTSYCILSQKSKRSAK